MDHSFGNRKRTIKTYYDDYDGHCFCFYFKLFRTVLYTWIGTRYISCLFSILSPFLGWIGVFLTGSVVSNNALFGNLQLTTAQQINVLPIILVAANTAGGVMAKMLSPQSIAVAAGAVGLAGKEGELFKYTLKYSMGFLILGGFVTFLLAWWL